MPGAYPTATAARREAQRERMAAPLALALAMRGEGRTLARIAETLNSKGYVTPNGGAFRPNSVLRLLALADET